MKAKNNKTVVIAVALVVVTACAIRLVNKTFEYENKFFMDFFRCVLHIGLFTAWGFSLYRRVVQKQARQYLCGIAILIILWLNFKVMRYYIITNVVVSRYLWYLYYLPLIGIPLYMLFASMFVGKTESYRLPQWLKLLYIPAVLLFLMIMTNDFHKFAFSFPQHDLSPNNYQYGIGYVLVFVWFLLCTLAAVFIMCSGCRLNRKYKTFAPLIVSLILTIIYVLTYLTGNKFMMYIAGDLSAACSLLFAAVLESCIYCGLLPTNTRYDEMFAYSVGNNAQIVDENYQVCYASVYAESIPIEQIKRAKNGSISISEGKLLHTVPIGGGYMVWTEDISELTNIHKELTMIKEELEERSAMLKNEYVLEKKRKVTEEQNRLYDLLTDSTQKQIDRIAQLMKEYELIDGETEKGNAILSRMAVLGGYVKRKKHLTLSIYNGFNISQGELKNAFDESIRYLQAMNVRCAVFVDTEQDFLPGDIVTVAYDFFEDAVEAALNSIFSCMVTVCVVEEVLRIRLTVGYKENLSPLQKDWPNASVNISDEDEWELILPLRGDESV